MLNRCILFISLALMLFACLPIEHSYVRGQYDSRNLLNQSSAYHTHPYQCLVALNDEVDPNNTGIINVGGNGNKALCLPSNELSYLVKAKKPTKTTITKKALKIAVLFDSSYSLRKTDPSQMRFDALKTYLLALFDKVESEDITASKVEVSFFPFKYCSHADFATKLTINKDDDRTAFENKIDALIGSGNGNAGGNAASKIKALKKGELTPDTLKAYGAYGSTNYLQAFAKAKKYLSNDSGARKNIVIFSDGLPLTYNDGSIDTYNADACKLPDIKTVTAENWQGEEGAKGCVLDIFYPSSTQGECTAPTSKDGGITGRFKAYSDPMNHLLGMIQHSQQISKAKGDIHIYAVHLKVCEGLQTGEKRLCQNISKPFFESFSDGYFPASDASSIAKSFDGVLEEQSKIDYADNGLVTLESADDDCKVSNGATAIQGISSKYKESDDFSFLKAQRFIMVGAYKGKASGKKGVEFVKLDANTQVNLGLPHGEGKSLTTIRHKAGALGEKQFKICSNFEYRDSCIDNNPQALPQNKSLEVHEYTDDHSNKIYCVLPKPVTVEVVVTPTVDPLEETEPPTTVDGDNTVGVITVTVPDPTDDDNNDGGTQPENPPEEQPTNTNTGVITVTPNNPPAQPPTNPQRPPTRPNPNPPTRPNNNPAQSGDGVGQNTGGVEGRNVPASGIKVENIPNWHIEY